MKKKEKEKRYNIHNTEQKKGVILSKAVIKAILSTPRKAGEREPWNC